MGTHRLATQRTRVIMKFFVLIPPPWPLPQPNTQLPTLLALATLLTQPTAPMVLLPLLITVLLPLTICCSRCCCRSCCCSRCSRCSCCSHCSRGDQQPVQSRGRGWQHCLRLPEHQQRRRAARNCQRQRRHRQLLLRRRSWPPQRLLCCR